MSGGVLAPAWQAHSVDYPRGAAWQADGRLLFVGDAAGTLYAFESTDGSLAWSAPAHAGGICAVAAHPRKPLVASGGEDGRIRLWQSGDGAPVHEMDCDAPWVMYLAWSPDGQRLASAAGRSLRLWDVRGHPAGRSDGHASSIAGLAWTRDCVATACYGSIVLRDSQDCTPRLTLDWKGSPISLAVSPDGSVIACGSQDKTVRFWRRATGAGSQMAGYPGKPAALAFDPASALFATSGAEYITLWSFLDGGPEGTAPGLLEGHLGPVTSLQFAHGSSRLASGAKDGQVIVWNAGPGSGAPVGIGKASGAVESVLWAPDDGVLAAIDAEGGVGAWWYDDA
jgi:WD40 repeat protein